VRADIWQRRSLHEIVLLHRACCARDLRGQELLPAVPSQAAAGCGHSAMAGVEWRRADSGIPAGAGAACGCSTLFSITLADAGVEPALHFALLDSTLSRTAFQPNSN
jgi:hypothetical protein